MDMNNSWTLKLDNARDIENVLRGEFNTPDDYIKYIGKNKFLVTASYVSYMLITYIRMVQTMTLMLMLIS